MGCSAAKNVTIEPMKNGGKDAKIWTKRKSHIEDLKQDINVSNIQSKTNGLAFEIPIVADFDDDDTNKTPPKRILELKESNNHNNSGTVTKEKLQEKLNEAETRRHQILKRRSQSAHQSIPKVFGKPKNNTLRK